MGGGKSTNTVEKSVDPWGAQQPYLRDIFAEAQRLYNTKPQQYYPGSTVAGVSPETAASQQGLVDAAQGQGQSVANSAAQASQFALTGALDVNNNPYLAKAIEGAQRPLIQQFNDAGGTMSAIRTDATNSGQYGSSRQGIAEGIATGRLNQTLGDISAKMMSEGYGQGLDAMKSGLALTPQTMQTIATPSGWMDAVGQQKTAYEQSLIDEAINRYNFNQTAPWNQLASYQNIAGTGSYGMSGVTSGPSTRSSAAMGALGGAATAAGIYGGLMSTGAVNSWNPYGWLALAAGGVLGAMSA